ncbi:hypothetical protein ACL7TT_08845 [Microbulbifer sp. 2304DJ12-6]|uniref:hypothetical protein n=1 Tax=Microbulbifer sp. 2304DJ12-6 TaxID=3233340 RepID=UPI0039AF658D
MVQLAFWALLLFGVKSPEQTWLLFDIKIQEVPFSPHHIFQVTGMAVPSVYSVGIQAIAGAPGVDQALTEQTDMMNATMSGRQFFFCM